MEIEPFFMSALVLADDAVGLLVLGFLVDDGDIGAEAHLLAGHLGDVDHLGGGDDGFQLRDTALDEGLLLARGVVFGILGEIAMGTRLRDRTDHSRALLGLQDLQLFLKPRQSLGRDGELLHGV